MICRLKPEEIEQAFQSWISSLIESTGGDIIAIDGKTARRSFDTRERRNALHAVSAWSSQHQLVLGQVAVDEKSNEIAAIPTLLALLDIEHCIITLDAMGCQKEIAKQIIQGNADYVLALKGNHSGMQGELEAWWHKSMRDGITSDNFDEFTQINAEHGRIEVRRCEQLLVDTSWLAKEYRWNGLQSIVKIHSKVEEKLTGKQSEETRWYISSLKINAEQALHAVQSHWKVESMHWMLGMTFREDECRIRKGSGALAFNVLRKIALTLLKQDKTKNVSMVRKKKIAAMNDEYPFSAARRLGLKCASSDEWCIKSEKQKSRVLKLHQQIHKQHLIGKLRIDGNLLVAWKLKCSSKEHPKCLVRT